MTEIRGRYERIDGRAGLRFVRELRHPVDRVWEAVTRPEGLAAWFPCRIDGDLLTVGAPLTFVFPDDNPEAETTSSGAVLEADPPRRLWFRWGDEELRIELEPLGPEGCRLTFVDLMPDGYLPGAARAAAGWHVCLDQLDVRVETGEGIAPSHEPTPRWRTLYARYVDDGVPHGAPIPGE